MNAETRARIQLALDICRMRCEYCQGDQVICQNLFHNHGIKCTVIDAEEALNEHNDIPQAG